MPLSKEKMRERKRLDRAIAKQETSDVAVTDIIPVLSQDDCESILSGIAKTKLKASLIRPSHVIQAIDMLNKMKHVYQPEQQTNIDNRQLNVYVNSEGGKDMLDQVMQGQRSLPPASTAGDDCP